MKRFGLVVSLALLACARAAFGQDIGVGPAQPTSVDRSAYFTVGDIKVEGLQRISAGTVFNYLPINIGDKLNPERIREAIRALYDTGFFRDVQFRRQGNTLIIDVLERPSIASFKITGNKAIKTKSLEKSLRDVGLATGKIFDRSVLEQVRDYLTEQYFNRGQYGVEIDAKVTNEPDNRVKVAVIIKEGKRSEIREINIVGNRRFTDAVLRKGFQLKLPNWLSWYKQDDRYSRESLQGDIERLRSYYMDRGYANFEVKSTQVQISPRKDNIYITINIHEGQVYKISSIKLAGTFVVPQADLAQLVLVTPGEIYSRKLITASQDLMQNRMGEDGYAFSKVDPVPTTDSKNHTVALTFFVDPGNRVYVRNITFTGVTKINDEVLRRELRQLEGGWLSNAALTRSKQRLQRLPYVKSVKSKTARVPDSPDQVDVNYQIKQGPGAELSGGVGYSQLYKLTVNGNYTDADFLGTGQRFSVNLEGGAYNKMYTVSETNPYATMDNVARTLTLSYEDMSQFIATSSQFNTKIISAALSYTYPLSEYQFVSLGGNVEDAQLIAIAGQSSLQAQQWVQDNGSTYQYTGGVGSILDPIANNYVTNSVQVYGTQFFIPSITGGWSYDSRNRTLFADRGLYFTLSGSYVLPKSSVQYWQANLNLLKYIPLPGPFTADFETQLGYAGALGNTTAPPPFALYYGGGPDSVRGFYPGTLGPKDQYGNPYGGNINVLGRAELILPLPKKLQQSARLKLFFDAGNIFSSSRCVSKAGQQVCGPTFYAPPNNSTFGAFAYGLHGQPINYNFAWNQLKESVGVAVEWLAPMGLFRFSFAVPLNAQSYVAGQTWGDNVEGFQFDMGQAF